MRYFDLHCDTASVCFEKHIKPDDLSLAVSTNKGKIFSDWCQCFAVFVPDDCSSPKYYYQNVLSDFKSKIDKFDNISCFFTLENGLPIDSLQFIDRIIEDKIRAVTLTWNGENQLAGGVDSDAGLKLFGRQVVDRFNDFGIACDLSHLNRRSFFDVAEAAKIVFASHSCCYKTHRHKRNLTDEQIKTIADKNGVVGICFYPEFLGTKYAFEGVYRHIYHLLNMGLENSICIGSDFDGADMASELDGVDKIKDLYEFLSHRGFSDKLLEKIFFSNANNFFDNLLAL